MSRYPVSREDMDAIRGHSQRIGVSVPSPSPGSALLDPATVGALSNHFDKLLVAIAGRVETVGAVMFSGLVT